MDPDQMIQRAPHSPRYATGWLHGWRLTFAGEEYGWDGPLATVVEHPGESVFVVLYDMTEEDENNLDMWEGMDLGFYRKLKVGVSTTLGQKIAWLYVVDGFEGGTPSAQYLSTITTAATKAGATTEYVEKIMTLSQHTPLSSPENDL